MSDTVVQGSPPRRSWLARFFGVIAELRTWKNLAYLVLAFPLGLFYFVFLVVGLAVGVGLVIIWVGLPILAVTVLAWWAFAGFERWQATHLLDVPITGSPAPWEGHASWWQRVKRHLGDARTWKDLAFLFLKFPLGIVSLVLVTVAVAVPAGLIGAPFYYQYATWTTDKAELYGINIGTWRVNTLAEALVLVPVGIVALFAMLHLMNLFAKFSGILAGALLDEGSAAPRSAPPAAPPPSGPADATPPTSPVAPTEPAAPTSSLTSSTSVDATPPAAAPGAPFEAASPHEPVTQGPPPPVAPGPPPPVAPGTPRPSSPEPPSHA